MKTRILRILALLAVLVASAVLLFVVFQKTPRQTAGGKPASLLPAETVRERLAEAGYAVEELALDGGLYEARLADGTRLYVDAASGTPIELPPSTGPAIPIAGIAQRLAEQGFAEAAPIVWRRGYYRTTARAPDDKVYELKIDPFTGDIVERQAQ